jgi:hypothetical protein
MAGAEFGRAAGAAVDLIGAVQFNTIRSVPESSACDNSVVRQACDRRFPSRKSS